MLWAAANSAVAEVDRVVGDSMDQVWQTPIPIGSMLGVLPHSR
jgi:hypothetical protein